MKVFVLTAMAVLSSLVSAMADPKADAKAKIAADYKQCSSKLPGAVREQICSSILAATNDKVWREKAYKSRGHARMELGRYLDAAADFTETIRLDPLAGYYDNRQFAYRQAGEFDDALSDAYAAVRIAPTFGFVWRSRALLYMDMAQYRMAIDDFHEALRLDPANVEFYIELGKAVDATGGTAEAIGLWSKALEIDDEEIEAFKLRGLGERKLGQTAAALADLERYQAIHPDDVDVALVVTRLRSGP